MPRLLSDKEEQILNKLNAKKTINSGATFGDTDGIICLKKPIGYGRIEKFAVEVKATAKKSMSVTKDMLAKMEKQAGNNLCTPILGIDISGKQYCLINIDDFADILEWCETKTL